MPAPTPLLRTATVTTTAALLAALRPPPVVVRVVGALHDVPSLRLGPGCALVGASRGAALHFRRGAPGVRLTADNTLARLVVVVDDDQPAIDNDLDRPDLGRVRLVAVRTRGRVELVASGPLHSGRVTVRGLHVAAADTCALPDRPSCGGVALLPAAVTLWNRQSDPARLLVADLRGVTVGSGHAPVRAGGVLVTGSDAVGRRGGRVEVDELATGSIWVDGDDGSSCGGVVVGAGADVAHLRTAGAVTTSGARAAPIALHGTVRRWTAGSDLTSSGAAAPGVLLTGQLGRARVDGVIETSGAAAAGVDLAGGRVAAARFRRVVTHGAGSVGVRVGAAAGEVVVDDGVDTRGGSAVVVTAMGRVARLAVTGGLTTTGPATTALRVAGRVGELVVEDGVHASGEGADAVVVDGGTLPLTDLEVTARSGVAVRLVDAHVSGLGGLRATGARGDIVVGTDPEADPRPR